jgi:predicted transcriptional regulator
MPGVRLESLTVDEIMRNLPYVSAQITKLTPKEVEDLLARLLEKRDVSQEEDPRQLRLFP